MALDSGFFEVSNPVATNADIIRAMTDEKLAVYLCRRFLDCSSNTCPGTELCVAGGYNANGLLKWLKQPAEVSHD